MRELLAWLTTLNRSWWYSSISAVFFVIRRQSVSMKLFSQTNFLFYLCYELKPTVSNYAIWYCLNGSVFKYFQYFSYSLFDLVETPQLKSPYSNFRSCGVIKRHRSVIFGVIIIHRNIHRMASEFGSCRHKFSCKSKFVSLYTNKQGIAWLLSGKRLRLPCSGN